MAGVLLRVAYDGSRFHGWSRQAGHRTVEEDLHRALVIVDPTASIPRGMSRTDSGVHAIAQMVAFDAAHDIPPRGWVLSVNSHLPDDVAVRQARIVVPGYNPRFTSMAKRYRYRLLLDRVRDPMRTSFTWRVGGDLDLDRMRREASVLVGTHDFAAFRAAGDTREVTVRTLTKVELALTGDDELHVVVEGRAFLYNMVRIIVGTLVDIGRDHRPEGTMARALRERDRAITGTTAPAHGLCLEAAELALPPESSEPWPP
jgi:tRNA pseudouridine38-40 synthase